MGEAVDLSDFDRGMIVGAKLAGFGISDAAERLGFPSATVRSVYKDWDENDKTPSNRQHRGFRCVDEIKMDRLVQADRTATISELTARYNEDSEQAISEYITRRILKKLGYIKQKASPKVEGRGDEAPDSKEKDAEPSDSAETKDLPETSLSCPQKGSVTLKRPCIYWALQTFHGTNCCTTTT
ncbi:hypothetical protein DNTS_031233 [Danionella cerebrum]|uniref:Transposase Tc1-like domain-containing protein n=1 Tax=Danionella cerebrum TaxID=2873325 RepID=A0A553MND3_9TELE|nr:hypothetical protein DNTS_031233 [Danionella translucida]